MAGHEFITREEWNAMPIDEQYNYVKVLEALLSERDRLVASIPACPLHGHCVNHAIEWVRRMQNFPSRYLADGAWCCQEQPSSES